MNRRSFLMTPAVAAAAGAWPGAAADQPGDIKLGVASYSLRKQSFAGMVQSLKALNIRYLKMKLEAHLPLDSTPARMAEAKRMLEDAGIVLECTGNNSMDKDEAEIRSKFEFHKALGVRLLGIAPTAKTLPIIERYCKEYDIRVALHNHGPEERNFPTPSSVLSAVKGLDRRVGLCIDVGHTARAGEDVVAAIRAAGPRLFDIDVKDLLSTEPRARGCDVGDGVLPIGPMFKTLKAARWDGVVHLEYEVAVDDPMPGMQKSIAYMRGVLAGLRA